MTKPSALAGLRVLDLAGPIAWYATRLLSDLGAEVTRIGMPDTSPTGQWLNLGKRFVPADFEDEADLAMVGRLAARVDVVFESFPSRRLESLGLDYRTLARENPRLVMTSVTPFGRHGPRAHWRGTDLIGLATGGLLHMAGCPGSPPSYPGGEQGYLLSGVASAAATLIALRARQAQGLGQVIDVSLQDAVIGALENAIGYSDLMGFNRGRTGRRVYTGEQLFFRSRDGWLAARVGNRAGEFATWLRQAGVAIQGWDPDLWHDNEYRTAHLEEFGEALAQLASRSYKGEFVSTAQRFRIPSAPVALVPDLLEDPQLISRDFWFDLELDSGEMSRLPGAPFKMTRTPWQVHSRDVAGSGPLDVTGGTGPVTPFPWADGSERPRSTSQLPLAGIRVLDFTWVIAGPAATQVLADHGADVIKIEGPRRPDGLRLVGTPRPPWTGSENGSGMFHLINGSKRSVAIDLNQETGRAFLKRLVRLVDVVVDNYGIDPFPKWGLDEESIRTINPDVVIARSSVMGRSGPRATFVGLGFTIGPAAGLNGLSGFPGDPPAGTGTAHPDYSSNPFHLLVGILAALEYRSRTGRGQTIDLSQHESTVVFAGEGIARYASGDYSAVPNANRHPTIAPHGVFRCRGEDRWVAIACETESDWPRLANAIERPDLLEDQALLSVGGRKANEDRLDDAITAWTGLRTAEEAALVLQDAGVPAGAVLRASDLLRDKHLMARGKLIRLEHPYLGWTYVYTSGFRFASTPGSIRRHSPLLGQDTEDVLVDLLGVEEEALANAYVEGAL